MWRYLFVLADEALRLLRARQARSGQTDRPGLKPGGSLSWRGRVAGGMAGSLFLRAFERSDRIYMAMVARGYDGEVRSSPLPATPAWQHGCSCPPAWYYSWFCLLLLFSSGLRSKICIIRLKLYNLSYIYPMATRP